jgi:hypothetical protein
MTTCRCCLNKTMHVKVVHVSFITSTSPNRDLTVCKIFHLCVRDNPTHSRIFGESILVSRFIKPERVAQTHWQTYDYPTESPSAFSPRPESLADTHTWLNYYLPIRNTSSKNSENVTKFAFKAISLMNLSISLTKSSQLDQERQGHTCYFTDEKTRDKCRYLEWTVCNVQADRQ